MHKGKEKDLTAKYFIHSTTTLTTPSSHSDGADIGPIDTLKIEKQTATTITDGERTVIEREISLTNAQIALINKIKRRQARAKGLSKVGMACFAPLTLILAIKSCRASWFPIWTAKQGNRVVQSLPSGKIKDLSYAAMTTIKTLCLFECLEAEMDMVQIGEAQITAHHHIHTDDGWMTARQASQRGLGRLLTNQDCQQVYSLYLEGGGNIMIITTALLQKVPTQLKTATMGCRLENPNNLHPESWLSYPDSLLAKLEQYIGKEKGRKYFRANEVTTEPHGELKFRLTPDPKWAEPLSLKIQATYPETGMATPQDLPQGTRRTLMNY